jgi:hypothetical protein
MGMGRAGRWSVLFDKREWIGDVEVGVGDCGYIAGTVRFRMRYGGNFLIGRVRRKKLFKLEKNHVSSYRSTVLFGPIMRGDSLFQFKGYVPPRKQNI